MLWSKSKGFSLDGSYCLFVKDAAIFDGILIVVYALYSYATREKSLPTMERMCCFPCWWLFAHFLFAFSRPLVACATLPSETTASQEPQSSVSAGA